MKHKYKDIDIYIMRHGGGWSYKFEPNYRHGEFSKGFETKQECVSAAEEEIDGKRSKYGKLN